MAGWGRYATRRFEQKNAKEAKEDAEKMLDEMDRMGRMTGRVRLLRWARS